MLKPAHFLLALLLGTLILDKPESTESSTQTGQSTGSQGDSSESGVPNGENTGGQADSTKSGAQTPQTGQSTGTQSKDGTLLLPYYEIDLNKPGATGAKP